MAVDQGTCRGCGRTILWFVNENGKKEPFDARPARTLVPTVADHIVQSAHLPHFVTCPNADQFRKGGKKP